jgi:hypothetical protein
MKWGVVWGSILEKAEFHAGQPREAALKSLLLAGLLSGAGLGAAEIHYIKDMHGKDYFPLGVNYAWVDWGKDFADKGWSERFKRIEKDFDLMRSRGVRTLRWWVYTDFVESPLWKGEGPKRRCTGMPEGWVKNFMLALDAAHARGIRLYPTFSSFDLGRKGFKEVVANKAVRQSFIKNAVRPILKAAGKHEGIFAWDIINEPEWLVRKEDNGDPNKELSHGPVSLAELRAYIAEMRHEVKASASQPVSVGSAGLKWSGWQFDFYSGLELDFFDVHYYDWMTPYFDITTIPKATLGKLSPEYTQKAMMVGETIPKPETQYTGKDRPKDHSRFLGDLIKMGYAGYLPWAWYEKPGMECSESIDPHLNRALKTLKLPGQSPP